MKRLFPRLLCLLLLCGPAGKAQRFYEGEEPQNEVKLNLFSLALKTVSIQYERNLRSQITVALGLRASPASTLPFRNQLGVSGNSSGGDDVVTEALRSVRLRNFAITPEVRYYFRRDGAARGLYGALFGRYAATGVTSSFQTNSNSSPTGYRDVVVDGRFHSGSIGLMLGAKFRLSNTVMLDWWIAGPMYTSGTIKLDVDLDASTLTPDDRDQIQQDADRGVTIGPLDLKAGSVKFREDGFDLQAPLRITELRTGLAIGIRF